MLLRRHLEWQKRVSGILRLHHHTAKQRYDHKLPGLVDDLYITPFVPGQRQLWPEIDTFSPYKAKGLHKSGWVYFSIQGWVSNVRILSLGEVSLLLADVKHSQKLTATPLHPWIGSRGQTQPETNPWIAAEWNGRVICAHCTCMAGLGEAYSTQTRLCIVLPDDFSNFPVCV